MRHWPDTLPTSLGPDYEITPADPFLRTDMEAGPARQRRLTSARRDLVTCVWDMSPPEYLAFDAWFLDSAWSLSGHSDDLSGWARQAVTWTPGLSLLPDTGLAAGRMLETAVTSEHGQTLACPGLASGDTAHITLSARAAGRGLLRVTLTGRDGVARASDIDLGSGAVAWPGGAATVKILSRGDGWWRAVLTIPAGIGAATAVLRLSLLQAAGVTSYAGDVTRGVDLAELNLRPSEGLYLPTDASGAARGAAGGAAWASVPLWAGGVYGPFEARFTAMPSTRLLPGRNTRVSASLEVRHA